MKPLDKGAPQCDALVLFTVEGNPAGREDVVPWLASSPGLADHRGKKNEITVCYGPPDSTIPRVILAGTGKCGGGNADTLRQAAGNAVRRAKALELATIAATMDNIDRTAEFLGLSAPEALREIALAARLAVYSFTAFRSAECLAAENGMSTGPATLDILTRDREPRPETAAALALAEAEAGGVFLARDLVNTPPNVMTPAAIAQAATDLADRHGFACRILDQEAMEKEGMRAVLAVSQGSANAPRCIILENKPGSANPLVIIGKGISFDSGGISLKPPAGMNQMKGDMAGAAAVLGMFEALGRLSGGDVQAVVGIIPCAENMPDGNAFRPGDVVTTMSGKTVEILSTDAEGRMLLCDALTLAQKTFDPAAIIDIATLTGACMLALGRGACGVFSTDACLSEVLRDTGQRLGDPVWPMPLWDRLREGLKSDVADLANVGEREGGAISAALFLKEFVDKDVTWAHLDIAGAGVTLKDSPTCPKGGTGFGVRPLFDLVRNRHFTGG